MKRGYILGLILGGVFFWGPLCAGGQGVSGNGTESIAVSQEAVTTQAELQKESLPEKNSALEALVKKVGSSGKRVLEKKDSKRT